MLLEIYVRHKYKNRSYKIYLKKSSMKGLGLYIIKVFRRMKKLPCRLHLFTSDKTASVTMLGKKASKMHDIIRNKVKKIDQQNLLHV